jgi:hypothetical protein
MNVTRLSLARILELRVPMTWRDAGAVLVEGVYRAQELGGTSLDPIAPDTVLVTRGGEVVLTGDAQRAHPEAVAALADDLLRGCEDRGDLGDAIASGDLLPFLESLSHDTSWKRRRVEIATLALRGIAAHADQLRSMIRARSAATADAAAGRSRREPRRAAGDHGFGATVDRHRESATGSSARRVSARAVIWTVVAISATAAGLSVWLADTGPFAPSPTTQGPVGRR